MKRTQTRATIRNFTSSIPRKSTIFTTEIIISTIFREKYNWHVSDTLNASHAVIYGGIYKIIQQKIVKKTIKWGLQNVQVK